MVLNTDGSGTLTGGLFTGVTPVRVTDTRVGLGGTQAKLGVGQWLTVKIAGQPGLPASGISGVVINLTATEPTQSSFLEVNETGSFTNTSDLNFSPTLTIANLVVSPVDASGQIHVYNSAGATHVLVDVLGYY